MKTLSSFIVGFVLAALLFGASTLQAQDGLPKDVGDYLDKAVVWTERIRSDYKVATDYLFNKSTPDKVKAADADLAKLISEMAAIDAPLAMRTIHEQLRFAGERCQNHISVAAAVPDASKLTAFDPSWIFVQREACIVQIHAARLMITEVGLSDGFDPFDK